MTSRFFRWILGILGFSQKQSQRGEAQRFTGIKWVTRTELPSQLKSKTIYFVGAPEAAKWVHFVCPCGCDQSVALNLMSSKQPSWIATFDKGNRVTIYPSIDDTRCGSHYWITNNAINWADYDEVG
jgi:hypothetical protein